MPACPRCGSQNLAESRFCQSCGSPLQIPAQPATPAPYYYAPPQPRRSSNEAIIVLAVVLIVVIVGAVAVVAFVFYLPAFNISRVVTSPGPVMVTGVYLAILYPNKASTGWYGTTFRSLNYPIFYMQHNEIQSFSFTLALFNTTTSHTVDTIILAYSGGFGIQSISPTLPYTTTLYSSNTFTVTVQAPNVNYSGPVTIDLTTH